MSIIFVLLANLSFLLILSQLQRRGRVSQFMARKILHFGSGMGAVASLFLLTQIEYVSLTLFFTLFYTLMKWKNLLICIEERTFHSLGIPIYPASLTLMGLLLWSNPPLHALGILLLAVPDSISAILEEWSKTQCSKSALIKTTAYFSLAFLLCLSFLPLSTSVFLASAVTLTEKYVTKGFDNIAVPVAYIIMLHFLDLW